MGEVRRTTVGAVDHIVVDGVPGGDVLAKGGDYAFDQTAGALYQRELTGWRCLGPADGPLHDVPPESLLPPEIVDEAGTEDPKSEDEDEDDEESSLLPPEIVDEAGTEDPSNPDGDGDEKKRRSFFGGDKDT